MNARLPPTPSPQEGLPPAQLWYSIDRVLMVFLSRGLAKGGVIFLGFSPEGAFPYIAPAFQAGANPDRNRRAWGEKNDCGSPHLTMPP